MASMHPSRLLVLIGAALGAASLGFDAVQSTSTSSWSMVAADAWPGAALIGAIAILGMVGHRAEGFTPAGSVVSIVFVSTAALLLVGKYIDASKAVDTLRLGGHTASIGIGMWVLASGITVTIVGSLWSTSRRIAS